MIASILSEIWDCRKVKKPCPLHSIRATLEAGINILRKSRYQKSASNLDSLSLSCFCMLNQNIDMKQKMILFLLSFLSILSVWSKILEEEGNCTKYKNIFKIINENENSKYQNIEFWLKFKLKFKILP